MKVNEKLKELREKSNLTYKEMANQIVEHGNRRLYYEIALKIAKVFKLKPDDLFYDYYNMQKNSILFNLLLTYASICDILNM